MDTQPIGNNRQAVRVQKSILNALEKKALVSMAKKLPKWVTSDMLTFTGTVGSVIIALGYALSNYNIAWLWLSSFGFVVNWFGDSMDGTLARVRNQQRPKYGFFLDHNMDCINEAIMFVGAGLSPLVNLETALLALSAYLILSVYVYISAHLKGEFKLTYAKMGPTEFRLIMIAINTMFALSERLRSISHTVNVFGEARTLHLLDYITAAIILFLIVIYFASFIKDAREYAKEEPLKH